jgi:hypothetical protein
MGNDVKESYGRRRRDRDRRPWWHWRRYFNDGYGPEDIRWHVYPPYYEPVYTQPPQQVTQPEEVQKQEPIKTIEYIQQPQQPLDKSWYLYPFVILVLVFVILILVLLRK